MTQVSLFKTGEELRDEALEQVAGGANDATWETIRLAVHAVCLTHTQFTTDDVWAEIDQPIHEPRVLGAIMRLAAQWGWCRSTGVYRKSIRPQCHARPVVIWQSQLR